MIEYEPYRASLLDQGEHEVWHSGDLQPTASSTLAVGLLSGHLVPGDYTVQVRGIDADGQIHPVSRFPFRIKP